MTEKEIILNALLRTGAMIIYNASCYHSTFGTVDYYEVELLHSYETLVLEFDKSDKLISADI